MFLFRNGRATQCSFAAQLGALSCAAITDNCREWERERNAEEKLILTVDVSTMFAKAPQATDAAKRHTYYNIFIYVNPKM